MATPIMFNINYVCSPYAVLGSLYYRHVLPDGTYSPWTLNSFLGTFPINTSGGTVTNQTLSNVVGNTPEFFPATTYQFYVEQTCIDEVTVDSAISDDIWVEDCPDYNVNVVWNNTTSSYDFMMNLYGLPTGSVLDPNSNSIINYSFQVYQITGGPIYLGTYVLPYTDIEDALLVNPNLISYNFPITQSDLVDYVNPASGPVQYEITMYVEIITSTGTETFACTPISDAIAGECDTYAIHTGNNWSLTWEDCNRIVRKIGGKTPQPLFYICARSIPTGYACLPIGVGGSSIAGPPRYVGGTIIHAIGGFVPSGWIATNVISEGAVVELPPGPGCDGNQYSFADLNVPVAQGGQGISYTSSSC
jgi:hypothetical protein